MTTLPTQIAAFQARRAAHAQRCRDLAALQLLAGVDLHAALRTTGAARANLLRRLRRLMERERLKGARGHAGYDLDRHIALKRSLDRLDPARRVTPGRNAEHAAFP